jgi:hypothetical protein
MWASSSPARPCSARCCSSFRAFAGIDDGNLNTSTAAFTTAFSRYILIAISASLIRFCAAAARTSIPGAAFQRFRFTCSFLRSLGPSRPSTCAASVAATLSHSTLSQRWRPGRLKSTDSSLTTHRTSFVLRNGQRVQQSPWYAAMTQFWRINASLTIALPRCPLDFGLKRGRNVPNGEIF